MNNIPFHYILFFLLASTSTIISQTTYNISDPEDLSDRIYEAGDEIILANGIYNSDERIIFLGNGTAENPIIFRAENPGGVRFTGGLKLNIAADFAVVDGFHWQGGFGASNFIQFRQNTDYANFSTLQNCVIDGLEIEPDDVIEDMQNNSITKHRWVVLYGTYNKILNCSFMNKKSAGALVLAEYEFNAEADACTEVGHTISNNYFYRYSKIDSSLSNAGDSETIRIGTSEFQNVNSNVTVSNNYFVEADGENEIISNKSKGNSYTNNTFRRSRGSLVLRHGSDVTVDQNFFLGENVEGTGGIRTTDSHHVITNNYIQDCITVTSQSIWNNGLTILAGNDNFAVPCTSSNVTTGYQKSENLIISNNTFVNTNAPLFYNSNKGTTDPTGTIKDNLIYFDTSHPNISNVISGDNPNSYANLGTTLEYDGNIYTGTELGESNAGFTNQTDITASSDGEIFSFSGTGLDNKGADLGVFAPITDDMVGFGIGACFLNNVGQNISNGQCTIVVRDQLTVGSLPIFSAPAANEDVSIIANVAWTAVANDPWISIDADAGNGNATVNIAVTENTENTSRVGSITFTQDPGGEDIIRTLTVTQEGVDLTALYDLINVGRGLPTDRVTLHSFSREEVDGVDKFNFAQNTLDKDHETLWAADDDDILPGEIRGDGEFIIYDLSFIHTLNLIRYSTTNKEDAFGFQVWTSTTGTEEADFSRVLPTSGDLLLTAINTTDFNAYEINAVDARYVKLVGFGRFNAGVDTRTSVWSTVREIEFYGSSTVSVAENEVLISPSIYPVPAKNTLHVENSKPFNYISVHDIGGRKILEKKISGSVLEYELDVSSMLSGVYFITLRGNQQYQSKQFIVLE